jgi:hypothetical protein
MFCVPQQETNLRQMTRLQITELRFSDAPAGEQARMGDR